MTAHGEDPARGDAVDQASVWCLRLAEGRLAPQTRAEFEAWLAADPAHAQAFDEVVRTWQALEQTHLSPELIAMRRHALDSFRRGHAARWNRSLDRRRRTWGAVAACLVLAAVGAGLWTKYAPQRYETGLGERRVVALADGSRMSLDAQSRVDVRLSGGRRELWLRHGRARFQVAHDSLRPFSVGAADKVVVATGTEFSVELLASQLHVILYQGSVDVLAGRRGSALQPVRVAAEAPGERTAGPTRVSRRALVPGNELIAGLSATDARIRPADPVRSLAWEAGQLAFNDEPLSSAVERMNRYADVPLSVGDPAAGRVRISGTFAAGDSDAFIEGVTGVFPVRVTETDGRRVFVGVR